MARPRRTQGALVAAELPTLPIGIKCRPLVGWPCYAVDNIGRVWSCKVERSNRVGRWHLLRQHETKLGYKRVSLRDGAGRRTVRLVHQLVLEAFVGPADGRFALHNDGNQRNNRLSNLRYGTQSDNMKDAIKHGTHNWAERIRG